MLPQKSRAKTRRSRYDIVEVIGYIIFAGVDLDEYWNYSGRVLYYGDILDGLECGLFPPGLIFGSDKGGIEMVARGRRTLCRLAFEFESNQNAAFGLVENE